MHKRMPPHGNLDHMGENNTNKTHYNIGKNIRKTIEKNHRAMTENLPTQKEV